MLLMADFISEVNKKNAKEKKKEIVLEEKRRKEEDEFNLEWTKFQLSIMFKKIVDAYADMPKGEECLENDELILFRSDDGENRYILIRDSKFDNMSDEEILESVKKNAKCEYQRSIACKVDTSVKARKAAKGSKKKD